MGPALAMIIIAVQEAVIRCLLGLPSAVIAIVCQFVAFTLNALTSTDITDGYLQSIGASQGNVCPAWRMLISGFVGAYGAHVWSTYAGASAAAGVGIVSTISAVSPANRGVGLGHGISLIKSILSVFRLVESGGNVPVDWTAVASNTAMGAISVTNLGMSGIISSFAVASSIALLRYLCLNGWLEYASTSRSLLFAPMNRDELQKELDDIIHNNCIAALGVLVDPTSLFIVFVDCIREKYMRGDVNFKKQFQDWGGVNPLVGLPFQLSNMCYKLLAGEDRFNYHALGLFPFELNAWIVGGIAAFSGLTVATMCQSLRDIITGAAMSAWNIIKSFLSWCFSGTMERAIEASRDIADEVCNRVAENASKIPIVGRFVNLDREADQQMVEVSPISKEYNHEVTSEFVKIMRNCPDMKNAESTLFLMDIKDAEEGGHHPLYLLDQDRNKKLLCKPDFMCEY